MGGRERKYIRPGLTVNIVLKQDQQTGRLTRGVVKEVFGRNQVANPGPSLREAAPKLPEGFRYRPELIGPDEDATLLARVRELPFREFEFHGYLGKRRAVSFGWHYDFSGRQLLKADDISDWARSPAVAPPRESLGRRQPPREAALVQNLLKVTKEKW